MSDLDEFCWLSGDEDGGVSVNCRVCDRGGLPVAYYGRFGCDNPYVGDREVESVDRIIDVYVAALHHVAVTHP